ncbi:hypothetical protein BT69DRAFT_681142 [Atractiella rhizophila]|nr:hypothetical protein BT69DRAFT_681142 [Atractiella rhizophila]
MEAEQLLTVCQNLEQSERDREIGNALAELGKTATFLRNLKSDSSQGFTGETGIVQVPCAICLEPVTNARLTPCGHLFCLECIDQALARRRRCPTCRTDTRRRNLRPVFL